MTDPKIIEWEVIEQFEMKEFNPTIEELTKLSESYQWLKIKWIDDKEWYELVKTAQLDLRNKRTSIAKFWKEMRDGANAYAKRVLEQERKLIAIIEWTENELQAERKRIDEDREIEKRKTILPDRQSELQRHWIDASDEYILSLTSEQFNTFVNSERERIINEKEAKLKKEQEQIIIDSRRQKLSQITQISYSDEILSWMNEAQFEAHINWIIEANKFKENKLREEKELEEKQRKEAEEQAKIDAERKHKKEIEDLKIQKEKDMIVSRWNMLQSLGLIFNWEWYFLDDINVYLVEIKTTTEEEFMTIYNKISNEIKRRKQIEEEKLEKQRKEQIEKDKKDVEEKHKNELKELEQKQKGQKEKEEKEKKEAEEKIEIERLKNEEKLRKEECYQKWLKENNYNDDDYYVQYLWNKRVLYKKVSEFIIPTDWI